MIPKYTTVGNGDMAVAVVIVVSEEHSTYVVGGAGAICWCVLGLKNTVDQSV